MLITSKHTPWDTANSLWRLNWLMTILKLRQNNIFHWKNRTPKKKPFRLQTRGTLQRIWRFVQRGWWEKMKRSNPSKVSPLYCVCALKKPLGYLCTCVSICYKYKYNSWNYIIGGDLYGKSMLYSSALLIVLEIVMMLRAVQAFVTQSTRAPVVIRRSPWLSSVRLQSVTTSQETSSSAASPPTQYPFANVETKWQRYWDENKTFQTPIRNLDKPKKYVLDMFPYPSGAGLHVGHPEGYTGEPWYLRKMVCCITYKRTLL